MMAWYGGNGWGWCSLIGHSPATVILWGVVFVAIAFAFGFALRQRSDRPAPTGNGSNRREGAVAARLARSETDNDEFWRRLM
jgi:uncharacterized membrane protein